MEPDREFSPHSDPQHPTPRDASYPSPVANPHAAAELEIMKAQNASSISGRNPTLLKYALLFLALVTVMILTQWGMILIEKSMGNLHGSIVSEYFKRNGALALLFNVLQFAGAITLLFTNNLRLARGIILAVGLSFLYFAVMDLINFNAISLTIDAFIVWKIYELYETV